MKQILLRFIILITFSVLGLMLFAFGLNLLIMMQLTPQESTSFGHDVTRTAMIIWLVSLIPGIASVFIQQKWRRFLLVCPLLLPAIGAFVYTVTY